MSGFQWFRKALIQYADIKGRASRSEFWYFTLFYLLIFLVLYILLIYSTFFLYLPIGQILFPVLLLLFVLGTFIPSVCVGVRRLHDIGKSGWLLLVQFIPLVGPILLLVWFLTESEPGENEWGPNPWEEGDLGTNISEHLV